MEEEGNMKTGSQSQPVGFVVPTSPSPDDESPLQKGKEPKSPQTSSSNRVGQLRTLIPMPNYPKHKEVANPDARTNTRGSVDRDAVLARVETEKSLALITAWEESEKAKVENRAYKMQSAIGWWEDSKKASVKEKLERKKAEYIEKMENKIAEIHQSAEEKKAMVKAKREEELLKVEETAAKFRSSGRYSPRKLILGCFSGYGFST